MTQALLTHTCAAKSLGGVLAVVVLEVVVDQLVDLLRGEQALLDDRVVEQPEDHHAGHDDVDRHRGDPPPAQPVERGREAVHEEQPHPAPGAGAAADGAVARPGQQRGQVRDQGRVRRRGAYDGQVGRDLLVALDQLVGLGSVQPALAGQRLEPLPLGRVRRDVGVEVHDRSLGCRRALRAAEPPMLSTTSWRLSPRVPGLTAVAAAHS